MSDLIFPDFPGAIYSQRVPMYRETIQESESGVEYRIKQWTRPRYRHSISWKLRRTTAYQEAQTIASFLCMHGARHESFLFRDPWDYSVTGMGWGIGDTVSTKFPLQRTLGGYYTDRLGTWAWSAAPRSNLARYSQAFDNAAWNRNGAAGGTCVVAGNACPAPDGTLTADVVTFPAQNTAILSYVDGSFGAGPSWTFSVWLRGTAGDTGQIVLYAEGGTPEEATKTVTMTGSWQRESVTKTLANGGHTRLAFFVHRNTGQTMTWAHAWGAQLELGSSATAYIPTTSAGALSTTSPTPDPAYWTANQTSGALVAPTTQGSFEPVTEPDWASVTLYKDGVALTPSSEFTYSGGLVTLATAPSDAALLTWTGTYHKRVRFDDEEPEFDRIVGDILYGGSIDLVAVI